MECEWDMAYAMVNHKEFFAEMSVTYLCNAYADSDHACPVRDGMQTCSPPLLAPSVVQRLYQKRADNENDKCHYPLNHHHLLMMPVKMAEVRTDGWFWFFHWLWDKLRLGRRRAIQLPPHCNKFYPFTRGQLRLMDAELYQDLEDLWERQIAEWEDEDDEYGCWLWRHGRGFICPRRHGNSSKTKLYWCWPW
jgi:hypothetical protein